VCCCVDRLHQKPIVAFYESSTAVVVLCRHPLLHYLLFRIAVTNVAICDAKLCVLPTTRRRWWLLLGWQRWSLCLSMLFVYHRSQMLVTVGVAMIDSLFASWWVDSSFGWLRSPWWGGVGLSCRVGLIGEF
jgi:hypothetical protein